MKQSKRKIKKANIKKRTKKYNYSKNQRGGWGFFSRDPQIITDMMKLPGFENIQVSFPFNNIQMDISLPDKPLNQFIDEWAKGSCFDQAKRELTDNIMVLNRTMPKPESKIERENRILTNLNTQTATPFNFSVIPNIVMFITNPYDISVIKSKGIYSELVENNNFVGGILQPKQELAGEQEITVPKEVYVLVKLMQQLTREYKIQTIYINGSKQPKFQVDKTEIGLPEDAYLYTTVCKGYANLLDNIYRMYKGTALDWSKVNTQILTSFFEDNSFQAYYTNFVKTFLNDTYNGPVDRYTGDPTGGQFMYSNAYRDGNVLSRIPDVSIDTYIRNYKDKYIDSSFFKLDPITENPGDGNFLQYVENITTYLITVNTTNIIIECVKIYYIFLKDIDAIARTPGAANYNGLIIAAIVEKKITDINAGVIHYSSQFRWLITKNTLENIKINHFEIPDPILRNLEEVRMSGDNRFIRFFKGSTSRGPPVATANAATANAAGFPDQEDQGKLLGTQELNLQEDYIDAQGSSKPRNPTGQWQDLSDEYEPEEGDVNVGGRKKNKTRRKLKKRKRSIKRKAKY